MRIMQSESLLLASYNWLHGDESLWKPTRAFLEEDGTEGVRTPTCYVHMPDAEHTWGFSHLCHCSDIFRQNFIRVKMSQNVYRQQDLTQRIKKKTTLEFHSVEEQPHQVTDSQPPVSPAWHPDTGSLCLFWYRINRSPFSFLWIVPCSYCRTFLVIKNHFYITPPMTFLMKFFLLDSKAWKAWFSFYFLLFFINMINNKILWNTLMSGKWGTHASRSK